MNNFFSYESKPMQIAMFIGDLILLNVIYIVCCIPIITIGAAQAGLFTACKVLLDKEDDSSPYAAFWKGMTTGIGTVTLAWCVMGIITALVIWLAVSSIMLGSPVWISCIAIALCAIFQTLIPAFHAKFGCTWWQLIRNSWFLLFAHPIRSIATVAMIWLPVICFVLMKLYDFMALTPIWGSLYFATVFCFGVKLLNKPFTTLTDHYNETHGIKPEVAAEAISEEAEEAEEEPVE